MQIIWVIMWQKPDGTPSLGMGGRAYTHEAEARAEAHRLIRRANGEVYSIHSLELVGSPPIFISETSVERDYVDSPDHPFAMPSGDEILGY